MSFFQQPILDQFAHATGDKYFIYSYETLVTHKKHTRLSSAIKTCCGTNIGANYLSSQYRKLNSEYPHKMDLVVITSEPLDVLKSTTLPSTIRGFLLVEKGECVRHPDAYCVNLVCAMSGTGAMLLGVYLYSIHHNPLVTVKMGILELANSYINVGGLCLYAKFGFKYDASLHGADCFDDHNNLPMGVDLLQQYGADFDATSQQIADIAMGASKGFPKPDICNLNLRGFAQKMAGMAKTMDKFIAEGVADAYMIDYTSADGTMYDFKGFYESDRIRQNPDQLSQFISELPSKAPDDAELMALAQQFIITPKPVATPSVRQTRRRNPAGGMSGGKYYQYKHRRSHNGRTRRRRHRRSYSRHRRN